jgi:hypothetical protein
MQAAQRKMLNVLHSIGLGDTLLRWIERRQRMDMSLAYGGMVGACPVRCGSLCRFRSFLADPFLPCCFLRWAWALPTHLQRVLGFLGLRTVCAHTYDGAPASHGAFMQRPLAMPARCSSWW